MSLLIAIVAGCLLGALIEVVLLRPMRGADIDTTMLIMIGAWIVMQNTEQYVWGGVAKSIATPFPETPLVIGPFSVSLAAAVRVLCRARADRRRPIS